MTERRVFLPAPSCSWETFNAHFSPHNATEAVAKLDDVDIQIAMDKLPLVVGGVELEVQCKAEEDFRVSVTIALAQVL